MEELFENSEHRPIAHIGDTVHRPTHWWTPAVHDLLNYLESANFPYSPRVLGFDDVGREILSYIEGESGKDGWRKITTDRGLANFAKLLRSYHDAIAGYASPAGAEWAYSPNILKPGEIMCHGDFGPWNIAWRGDEPVGILDWDFVLPAKPEYDIFYALEFAAPFRDDETTLKWHHFTTIPDRKHRIKVFLKAYGIELSDIVANVASVQRTGIEYVQYLANRGLQPQVSWVKDGYLSDIEKRAKWTETNRQLFE
jgi:hypothetical protein